MRVCAAGDNCVDVYEREGRRYPGGNPVNVAVYLRRMGIDASYVGAVGTDAEGSFMLERLQEKGVDTSHVHVEEGATAVTKVEIVNGNRVFGDYLEGVMESFRPSDDDISFACTHDLYVSGIWGHTEDALARIHASGTTVVFDYSDQPDDPLVDATLAQVDYAFFGLEETDSPKLRTFMEQKQAMGPKAVVVTLGEHGSLAWDGSEWHAGGIVACDVVDTMGAGDSYIAGFIKGILDGASLDTCMRLGAESSAVTLGYSGAW